MDSVYECKECGRVVDESMAAFPESWVAMQDGTHEYPVAPGSVVGMCIECSTTKEAEHD
jgi:hypothetical protein